MKYDAKYIFMTTSPDVSRHLMCDHIGVDISGFTPEWVSLLWLRPLITQRKTIFKPGNL